MAGTGLYAVKKTPTKSDDTQSGAPVGQVITLVTGGLGVAAAYAGGYITNVTRSETRAIVSHIDDAATLEGSLTNWLDTDDLDIFDAWSTIQAACDQLLTDQGATLFTSSQYVKVYAGTYVENVVISGTLNDDLANEYYVIVEGDSAAARSAIDIAPAAGIAITGTSAIVYRHFTASKQVTGDQIVEVDDCVFAEGLQGRLKGYYHDSSFTNTGGLAVYCTQWGASMVFRRCTFTGATGVRHYWLDAFTAESCTFNIEAGGTGYSNIADHVEVTRGQQTMRNCTFYGGDYGIAPWSRNTFALINCIFSGVSRPLKWRITPEENTAGSFGPEVILRNNCFHDYTAFSEVESVDKTYAEFTAYGRVDAAGDLDATDPLMTDPASGDFSLQAASPARHAGHGSGVVSDVDGTAYDKFHPDIGAKSTGALTVTAPAIAASDNGDQDSIDVDIIPDNELDSVVTFYQALDSGGLLEWPTPLVGTGTTTLTGLLVQRYLIYSIATRNGVSSEPSLIEFVTVAAANEVTNYRTALREWVKGVVGNPEVDWRESNAPESIRPYVTIKMGPILTVGSDHHGGNDETGVETVAGDREFVFFIQVHGKQSDEDEGEVVSMLNRIRSSLEKRSVQATLGAASLAFVAVEGSSDLSGIGGTRWEARAFIDIRFNTTYSDTDDVGLISEVETPAGTLE